MPAHFWAVEQRRNKVALENGLYKVAFQTPLGEGYGVAVIRDGRIEGGDSMMFYRGTFQEDGDAFTANVQIGTHSQVPGMDSVFGVPEGSIELRGDTGRMPATMKGASPQAPGIGFQATLSAL
tara:strand:- start:280 stop:648 length:369 start_codon:yes stop_codon:yes gene_type:complete